MPDAGHFLRAVSAVFRWLIGVVSDHWWEPWPTVLFMSRPHSFFTVTVNFFCQYLIVRIIQNIC
jgi:hypothetical protein